MEDYYGPGDKSQSIPASLAKFKIECDRYVDNLSLFDKYCIWRYTIGSASVNGYLITGQMSENAAYWAYLFFTYWANTAGVRVKEIPRAFAPYLIYMENPDRFQRLVSGEKMLVASMLIKEYIKKLQSLILGGPKVGSPGFYVYKISSSYPGIDNIVKFPTDVVQDPFNSTTINRYFNFAIFSKPESTCCLFNIYVPPGSRCLWVPSDLHAYSFELEIIMPFGADFQVQDITEENLHYIDPADMNIQIVQNKRDIRMGNVYVLNDYKPCISGNCFIQSKKFRVYHAILRSSAKTRKKTLKGGSARGWRAAAPKRGKERNELKKKCGSRAFLRPADNGYPVMLDDCKYDCQGLTAAYVRARQYHDQGIADEAQALRSKYC